MIQREREMEGDEFVDKEKFVTQAYKDQLAANRKAEEDEKLREGVYKYHNTLEVLLLMQIYRAGEKAEGQGWSGYDPLLCILTKTVGRKTRCHHLCCFEASDGAYIARGGCWPEPYNQTTH